MKDNNIQNIADLIGALAEDIEEVKKKLDATDNPDKDEAVKRLAVKLSLLYVSLVAAHRKTSVRFSGAGNLSKIIRNHCVTV